MAASPEVLRVVRDYIQQVRKFMRDDPALNRLVLGEESNDHDIAMALQDSLLNWARPPGPPLGAVTILTHPAPDLLVLRTVARLLMSVSLLQTRNNLQYTDGQGVSVNSSANGPELRQIAQMLMAEYDQAKLALKIQLNIEGGWGTGVRSDLGQVNNFLDSFPDA